jgi:hypothetical protein
MPVGAAIWDVSPARVAAAAATALYPDGIRTLGQLASMTNEDLRRVPRLGTGGMRVIRKVLDLWHAKQQATARPGRVGPGDGAAAGTECDVEGLRPVMLDLITRPSR